MISGLRSWQSTGSGNFQPTPENIREWAEGEPAPDAPKAKTNPDCIYCGGTGLRLADGRKWSERDNKRKSVTRCDCAIVVYGDVVYRQPKFQLVGAPEDRKQPEVMRQMPEIPQAKAMPSAYAPNDAELERKKREAIELAKKFKGNGVQGELLKD